MRTIGPVAIRVEWVRYGPDAVHALRGEIAAVKAAEPLAPVTVVVPSNHVGVATRRALASGAFGSTGGRGVGLVAVSFVTPYRLAELLAAPTLAGSGRRPVSTPVIAAAVRAALADAPGAFAPVAGHAATEAALVAAYRELREASPSGLAALAATSPRAADVVRIHRAARTALEPAWYDEQDLMAVAAAAQVRGGASLGSVVVHLPQHLSRHAAALLAAVGAGGDVVVLAGTTGDERADADVVDAVRRVAGEEQVTPQPFDPHAAAAGRTRVVVASDGDDEVRIAVRAVVEAVHGGTPLDRVAVLYASPEPYARLAHEHLAAAGLATNGPAVTPLAGRVAGRAVLDLLALPERGFRRQDVFAWLTSAPMLVDGRWAPTGTWERLSREAGVVAGRDDWDARLETIALDSEAQADAAAADADQGAWRVDRLRQDAARARRLRAFVLGLIDDIAAAAARPRQWREHAQWARRHVTTLLGPLARLDSWPPAERKAAERVDAALDRLAALDAVEGAVDLDVFRRTLALELDADLGRVGRFGEGVLVAPLSMGVALELDVVVVLGLAEGTCPAPVRDDSLLPDHERSVAGGELVARRSHLERQHRELLAALAGARQCVLGVPRGDLRRSTERVPSRWVLDIASALAGERWWGEQLYAAAVPWVEHAGSFEDGLRRLRVPATAQEHRVRSLLAAAPAGASELAGSDDAVLSAGAAMVAARRSGEFSRFDGNLAGLAIPSPVDRATSATSIQRWAECPFAYLVRDLFGIDEVENPEDRLEITPLDRGNLVHQALERYVREVLDSKWVPRPDAPWPPAWRATMDAIGRAVWADYEARGLTGRPIFWDRERRRILRDLQRFLDEDDLARREAGSWPVAAELPFGLREGPLDAVGFDLADGRRLRFRGKADRVDCADDGTVHVVDYKTGSTREYTALNEDEPDQRGRRLQLPIYGLAARAYLGRPEADVRADFWFVTEKGGFERKGYPITPAVLERVRTTLGTIVHGIESGVFASHPSDGNSTSPWVECAACDPDGLGHIELRRAWERKRATKELAPYADLAEPLAEAVEQPTLEDVARG